MYLSENVARAVIPLIGDLLTVGAVSGGSINNCYEVQTNKGKYFLKTNSADQLPDLFLCETEGLKRIRETKTVAVPSVVAHGRAGMEIFLILEWIESETDDSASYLLGQQLAQMHRTTAGRFGLDHDNYVGSLRQHNNRHSTWYGFFSTERIEPQLKISYDKNLINNKIRICFDVMLTKLQSFYSEEIPSLVHGDLWSGNSVMGKSGPFLIDPAVYYGNREVDLAMTTLFGGFSQEFYAGYMDEFPLHVGWHERLDIWNLYPLLIHLNLFGTGYLPQIERILKRFT